MNQEADSLAQLPGTGKPPRRRRRRRLLSYSFTLWFILTLNFILPRAMPGDPIKAMLASSAAFSSRGMSAEEVAAAKRYYGLERPLWEQYGHYLGGLAQGDLGLSTNLNRPVADLVAERLPWTLLLATTTIALGTVIGVMAGVYTGWRRGRKADRALIGVFAGLAGMPPFFLASLAVFVFAVKLQWFPLGGATTPFARSSGFFSVAADVAWHLVLPAATGAVLPIALTFLTMRAGMVAELGSDYLLLGRAKGLRERALQYRYAARNAVLPVVAMTALGLGVSASGGVVLVERVFAYPGIGTLVFESISTRDYPTLQGCFLVVALMVVTANFCADVLTARLDPRTIA